MADIPELTILLGPQTRASLALNAHLRENRHFLSTQGIAILPNRVASPILRRALDDRPEEERLEEFIEKTSPRPTILSALNMFGPPQAGLVKGELFPDAELALAGLGPIIGQSRIVCAVDPLPEFFLAAQSEALEARVRQTDWEVLYELSWSDLVAELLELLPDVSVLLLTSTGTGQALNRLSETLVGAHGPDLPHPYTLLRNLISETGHAVLDRMIGRDLQDTSTLADLYESFAIRTTEEELRERLGIDKTTGILLNQRFQEDLERIAKLPRVEVI